MFEHLDLTTTPLGLEVVLRKGQLFNWTISDDRCLGGSIELATVDNQVVHIKTDTRPDPNFTGTEEAIAKLDLIDGCESAYPRLVGDDSLRVSPKEIAVLKQDGPVPHPNGFIKVRERTIIELAIRCLACIDSIDQLTIDTAKHYSFDAPATIARIPLCVGKLNHPGQVGRCRSWECFNDRPLPSSALDRQPTVRSVSRVVSNHNR